MYVKMMESSFQTLPTSAHSKVYRRVLKAEQCLLQMSEHTLLLILRPLRVQFHGSMTEFSQKRQIKNCNSYILCLSS
jgi:hypothetical protein